jgi:hypothetical protein
MSKPLMKQSEIEERGETKKIALLVHARVALFQDALAFFLLLA